MEWLKHWGDMLKHVVLSHYAKALCSATWIARLWLENNYKKSSEKIKILKLDTADGVPYSALKCTHTNAHTQLRKEWEFIKIFYKFRGVTCKLKGAPLCVWSLYNWEFSKTFYKFRGVTCKLRGAPLCIWGLYKLWAEPLYLHKKSLWAERSILVRIKLWWPNFTYCVFKVFVSWGGATRLVGS